VDVKVPTQASIALHESIIIYFEKALSDSEWIRDKHKNVWDFGSAIAMAACSYDAGADQKLVDEQLEITRRFADEIDIIVPLFPSKTGNKVTDSADILHYLLHSVGRNLSGILKNRFGYKAVQFLELATKSHLLLIIYEPNGDLTQSILSIIKRKSELTGLRNDLSRSLTTAIESATEYDTIKREIFKFTRRVSEFLTPWNVGD
jgi:hypothetical protein